MTVQKPVTATTPDKTDADLPDTGLPDTAMVLAAGRGVRMRPLTDSRPKPLVEVAGRTLIDRVLDHLAAAGIARAVVNLHHMADMLETHLADRARTAGPTIEISDERDTLLDTGGGVKRALPLLGDGPFYVINSDALWQDSSHKALERLAGRWDDAAMDALLLLVPTVEAVAYDGPGDFDMDPDGRLTRRDERTVSAYLFGGVQILHPRLFEPARDTVFSNNRLWDAAQDAGRLFGLVHEGLWARVGTPDAIRAAERMLVE